MAVCREPKYCMFCGGLINKIYLDQSGIPPMMQIIGDTFIRYDYENHVCDKEKKQKFLNSLVYLGS